MNPKQQGLHLIHINHPVKGRDLIGMCVVLITNLTSVKQIEHTASILQYYSTNFRQSIVLSGQRLLAEVSFDRLAHTPQRQYTQGILYITVSSQILSNYFLIHKSAPYRQATLRWKNFLGNNHQTG